MTQFISCLFGCFARIKRPKFLIQWILRAFIRAYKIDLSIAKKTDFNSLSDLFIREIKKDFLAVPSDSFIHPVEGVLITHGQVKEGQIFLIKGKNYSIRELMGTEEDLEGYFFYNYYLSPQDYHRVHHPVSGKYIRCNEIKGALYPVAPWFIKLMPSVFAKNYRTVSVVESEKNGLVYTIMVGALNVGSLKMIEGFFSNEDLSTGDLSNGDLNVRAGKTLGIFEMGSSVVVLCKKELDVTNGRVFFEIIN